MTAQTLGFCGLALGFVSLIVGIVLSVIDRRSKFVKVSERASIILEPVGGFFEYLLFLLDWKWTAGYLAIIFGISAIVAGTAALLFA